MRSYRIQQSDQCLELITGNASLLIEIIDQRHHSSDSCIVFQVLIIAGNFLDGLVNTDLQVFAVASLLSYHILQLPYTVQETTASAHTFLAPCGRSIKGTDKHLVGTQSICTELIDDIIRINNISTGFTHLLTVGSQDHTVGSSLLVRFRTGNYTLVIQELVPETGIQKMQCGMLHTAIVPVNRHPVVQSLLAGQCVFIVGICVAKEIPGRTCPLGHGICLTLSRSATAGTCGLHPVSHLGQRRFPVICRFIILYIRKLQRQLALIQRHISAFRTFYDRDRLTPVTLSGEYPVTQLEVSLRNTASFFFQPLNNSFLCFFYRHACQETGINQCACSHVSESFFFYVTAGNNLNDRQTKLLCKLPVTGIVSRNSHDCTGTIGHQYIIGYPDRDLFSVYRIDGGQTIDLHTRLLLGQLSTLKIRLLCSLLTVSYDLVVVFDLIFEFIQIRMLRRYDHISYTKQSIRSGGIDLQFFFFIFQREFHLSTVGTTDPVLLGNFYSLDIIHAVQIIDQLVSISCDL